MLPEQVTLLPVFLMFRTAGWTGTLLPLIVPPFFGNAFAIFLLRQFFLTIPQELSDAARIDGCGELLILRRIILPLAVPAVATVALFAFIGAWTDFVKPLVYLTSENTYTLALGLQAFVGRHASQWKLLMAAATVVMLPLLGLFLLTQKTFIEGVALTGVKASLPPHGQRHREAAGDGSAEILVDQGANLLQEPLSLFAGEPESG